MSGAWREGASTAAFSIPDSTIQVMLDAGDSDDGGPSGFYEVADVDAFHADHRDSVNWVQLPQDLPRKGHEASPHRGSLLGHRRPPGLPASSYARSRSRQLLERWTRRTVAGQADGQVAEPEWRRKP